MPMDMHQSQSESVHYRSCPPNVLHTLCDTPRYVSHLLVSNWATGGFKLPISGSDCPYHINLASKEVPGEGGPSEARCWRNVKDVQRVQTALGKLQSVTSAACIL